MSPSSWSLVCWTWPRTCWSFWRASARSLCFDSSAACDCSSWAFLSAIALRAARTRSTVCFSWFRRSLTRTAIDVSWDWIRWR